MKIVCRTTALAALVAASADAFAPSPQQERKSLVALDLVPRQGSQLAAAWNAAHPMQEDLEDDDAKDYDFYHELEQRRNNDAIVQEEEEEASHTIISPTSAMRSFVSRLFHLPCSEEPDVVVYPVVGFQWVKCSQNKYRVLPTTTVASCRVPPPREEVYGWFSPSCRLGEGSQKN